MSLLSGQDDLQDDLSDEALAALASRPDTDPGFLVALAANEARLSRAPAIATALYANPAVPLSVANKAVTTCRKMGVAPEGIPGFADLADAIAADPTALDAAVVDGPFTEALRAAVPAAGGESGDVALAAPSPSPASPPERRSAIIDFTKLKLFEKIRLATLGNANCRQTLLRDPNRMVALAAIRSPRITDSEIAKAAGNRAVGEEVIRYISNRKELIKLYAVKLALVGNPKCPLATALRLLPLLQADDLKQIARSKNVPGALSAAAKRLAVARGPQ